MAKKTLIHFPNNRFIFLKNKTCVYCGVELTPDNSTKEHVVAQRFVPKGKFDRQTNLIVRACKEHNALKGQLEDDISAISMQPDAMGRHPVSDQSLAREAKRKSKSFSRLTKKTVGNSTHKSSVKLNTGFGVTMTFGFIAPPQVRRERVFQLAEMQLMAFFYFVNYNKKTKRGRIWPGIYHPILYVPKSDWGNPRLVSFMNSVTDWDTYVIGDMASGFFKIVIRKNPKELCWSWALEWNKNYRVIGFLGDKAPVESIVNTLDSARFELIKADPEERIRVREEIPLGDNDDDCLFFCEEYGDKQD